MASKCVRMNKKHQIVIPTEVREALGVGPGDELIVTVEDGAARLTRSPGDWAAALLGLHREVWEGVDAREYVRREREGWAKQEPQR